MATSEPNWKDCCKGSSMSNEPLEDVREVTRDRPDNTYVFCFANEVDTLVVDLNWRND